MRMWQAAILVNLALVVGLGFGYGAWGRRVPTLDGELKASQAQAEQLRREREACFAGAHAGEQLWEGRGIVRAVYPKLILITHEEISGLLPARTTGFRLADSASHSQAHAGDPVRFWVQGTGYDNNVLVRMEAW
ncbi:MAG: copper-binding protein [Acetobacteraceae bacterium]|nr:copper-binding protein [Acetobacteraceae bacterium]